MPLTAESADAVEKRFGGYLSNIDSKWESAAFAKEAKL
jgi:hypothetical protein